MSVISANLGVILSLLGSAIAWAVGYYGSRRAKKIDTDIRFVEQIDFLNNRILDLNKKYFVVIDQIAQLQVENTVLKEQLKSFEQKQCIHSTRICLK